MASPPTQALGGPGAMIPPAHAPAFLAAHGWAGATILPLAGDASFRRYFRVVLDGRTAVLMDAPPEHEDLTPFLAIAAHLAASACPRRERWRSTATAGCCCSRISATASSARCCGVAATARRRSIAMR